MEKKHSHHQFVTVGGTSGRPKYTTRHLAALDFLLGVPMKREEDIRRLGVLNATRMKEETEAEMNMDDETLTNNDASNKAAMTVVPPSDLLAAQFADYAGKKLQGPHCPVGKYPIHFRYSLQKLSEHSALVRQWEDQLLAKTSQSSGSRSAEPSVLSNRIYFSRTHCYPLMAFSVIKYDAGEEKARIEKIKAEDAKGLEVYNLPHRDWRGFSYKPLFKQLQEERSGEYYFERGFLFDPNSLDDPAMIHGAHRYVLQRSASTGPILSSIILYVNKKELKESLNEQFHEKHPHIPPSLTLSKIRNLKKEIVLVGANKLNIELSTLAIGCILFEKLCLKCLVTKTNRRLSMAVCMLLAYKFNENNSARYHKALDSLLAFFDTEWDLPRKQVFEAEFGAYVHLNFLMHVPSQHVHWMYMSLLKLVNKSSRMYLKEDMYEVYHQDVAMVEHLKDLSAEYKEMTAANAALQAAAAAAADTGAMGGLSASPTIGQDSAGDVIGDAVGDVSGDRRLLASGPANAAGGSSGTGKRGIAAMPFGLLRRASGKVKEQPASQSCEIALLDPASIDRGEGAIDHGDSAVDLASQTDFTFVLSDTPVEDAGSDYSDSRSSPSGSRKFNSKDRGFVGLDSVQNIQGDGAAADTARSERRRKRGLLSGLRLI